MELLRKDHGFWGTMDEMFEAPSIIKYVLVHSNSMKHFLVGGEAVSTSIAKENLIELLAKRDLLPPPQGRGKRDSYLYFSCQGVVNYINSKLNWTGLYGTSADYVSKAKLLWPAIDPGMNGSRTETNSDAEELARESFMEGEATKEQAEPSPTAQCPDHIGQAQTSQDPVESFQTPQEQNESPTVNSDSPSDEMEEANKNDEHHGNNPVDCEVEEMPVLGQASNSKNADTTKNAPALTRHTVMSGPTEAPQTAATPQTGIVGEVGTNNHTETNANAYSSQVAREMSELELGPLYKDIKGKLARSKSKDEKVFYGHLKHYFARKLRSGNLLSKVEFDRIKTFMARYESNLKLLDDKGNYYDDICVYRGFLQHIMSECERELAISDVA
mmetsp:Transcript_30588/g.52227  ORF Transcript_30588/g.52227 Transcript_30588/m.52227 type:complete len:386 (+) Transcript_30588:574-1731(+)